MRFLVPAAAAATLLALAGCSDPEPGSPLPTGAPAETSTTTVAPSPTATATPTDGTPDPGAAPTLSPEATTNDAAGAEAFVRYWYDSLNYAIRTGDTAPVREASLLPECVECEALAASVESAYDAGGSLVGGRADVVEAIAPTPDGSGAVLLSVVVQQQPLQRIDGAGDVVSDDTDEGVDESSQSVVIGRNDTADGWLMVGLGQ
ncbi:DUF6318 family protein [uncultured Pseudokineococcus sp.]|uniref:DUF6318 family protein n=1 Tax=uncultured Pseudokineococcus sp. TaxID=1642928 RepID=UPI00263991BD|nr:DUF6318 family protein [uncultured Pseudokineococcus sp.]